MVDARRGSDPADHAEAEQALHRLARAWSAAADRAFASGMADPESYVRTTRLAAAVTAALRARGRGAAPLLAAWAERAELVAEVARSEELLTAAGLDSEAVAGAAFAMRYREVAAELVLDRRLAALAAETADSGWTVVEESGYSPGDPYVPYRRLEVEPTTGHALLVTTRADDGFTACVHAVERLRMDLATGELHPPTADAAGLEPPEYPTAEEREAEVARAKSHWSD